MNTLTSPGATLLSTTKLQKRSAREIVRAPVGVAVVRDILFSHAGAGGERGFGLSRTATTATVHRLLTRFARGPETIAWSDVPNIASTAEAARATAADVQNRSSGIRLDGASDGAFTRGIRSTGSRNTPRAAVASVPVTVRSDFTDFTWLTGRSGIQSSFD